ncbi:unnamed protein product [Vitrella brassicaformis CCMP3155]|uniref:Uncharacterized protein n=1 Tax=Vitrella brassicaformis (strain CCMP3155) TaxID=1169540 RepID=A0A0G4F8P3_VITBC|nr:unnamed protein product [Vitrella brassicaformis CCMP3155]|eukprot:CEM08928.1 unnamed protein product [Vitrella brassicaformis CCMP3155]
MIKALRDSHEAVTHLLVSEKKIQRNETQLRTMVEWCADSGIFTIADVVMNHLAAMDDCCDTATSLPFHDEHAVTGNLNVFKNPCFDSCATHMCVFEAVCQRTAGWCGRLQSPLTQCLDRPELLYCVKGSRPHPNQLSGSDLHGHQPTPDPPGDPSDSGFQLGSRPADGPPPQSPRSAGLGRLPRFTKKLKKGSTGSLLRNHDEFGGEDVSANVKTSLTEQRDELTGRVSKLEAEVRSLVQGLHERGVLPSGSAAQTPSSPSTPTNGAPHPHHTATPTAQGDTTYWKRVGAMAALGTVAILGSVVVLTSLMWLVCRLIETHMNEAASRTQVASQQQQVTRLQASINDMRQLTRQLRQQLADKAEKALPTPPSPPSPQPPTTPIMAAAATVDGSSSVARSVSPAMSDDEAPPIPAIPPPPKACRLRRRQTCVLPHEQSAQQLPPPAAPASADRAFRWKEIGEGAWAEIREEDAWGGSFAGEPVNMADVGAQAEGEAAHPAVPQIHYVIAHPVHPAVAAARAPAPMPAPFLC